MSSFSDKRPFSKFAMQLLFEGDLSRKLLWSSTKTFSCVRATRKTLPYAPLHNGNGLLSPIVAL